MRVPIRWRELPNGDLEISVDAAMQTELREERASNPEWTSDANMWDALEDVWTNGLSHSISASDTGDLTDAPMLCEGNRDDGTPCGKYWAYMSYQLRSPLDDLADDGKCIWTFGGDLGGFEPLTPEQSKEAVELTKRLLAEIDAEDQLPQRGSVAPPRSGPTL